MAAPSKQLQQHDHRNRHDRCRLDGAAQHSSVVTPLLPRANCLPASTSSPQRSTMRCPSSQSSTIWESSSPSAPTVAQHSPPNPSPPPTAATASPLSPSVLNDPLIAPANSLAAPSSTCLDRSQPLVFRVGALGPQYWEWVHTAEPGAPRFFGPDWAENCTKTPWWVVPLIWMPLFLSCSATALLQHGLRPLQLTALLLAGVVAWQAFEYFMHRCLFHAQPRSYSGITLHFLFHGCHHKYPMDVLRLVMPPLPGGVVIGLVYLALTALLPMGPALGLFSGMGFGYVAYDCLHYAMHHGRRLPGALLAELSARHAKHHHKDHSKGYGISSVLFDALLGTRHKL